MNSPVIRFDWNINVGHIISILVFILSGVAAWYDVKTDVRVFETKFKHVEEFMTQQKRADETQDIQREKLASEIKDSMKDIKNDIKQEIRDLRNDLIRKPTVPR